MNKDLPQFKEVFLCCDMHLDFVTTKILRHFSIVYSNSTEQRHKHWRIHQPPPPPRPNNAMTSNLLETVQCRWVRRYTPSVCHQVYWRTVWHCRQRQHHWHWRLWRRCFRHHYPLRSQWSARSTTSERILALGRSRPVPEQIAESRHKNKCLPKT